MDTLLDTLAAHRAQPPAMSMESFAQAIGQRLEVGQAARGEPSAAGEPQAAPPQMLHSVSMQEFRQFGTPGSAVHKDMPPPGQSATESSLAVPPDEGRGPFLPQPMQLPSLRVDP